MGGINEDFFYLKGSCKPSRMEYSVFQMSVAAPHGGTDSNGSIFDDSDAWIRLNSDDVIGYIDFEDIGRLQLIVIDLQLH